MSNINLMMNIYVLEQQMNAASSEEFKGVQSLIKYSTSEYAIYAPIYQLCKI